MALGNGNDKSVFTNGHIGLVTEWETDSKECRVDMKPPNPKTLSKNVKKTLRVDFWALLKYESCAKFFFY